MYMKNITVLNFNKSNVENFPTLCNKYRKSYSRVIHIMHYISKLYDFKSIILTVNNFYFSSF